MSACKQCGMREPVDAARVEVRRCAASMLAGGSVVVWTGRLERAAKDYEAAAAILRMQLAALSAKMER